MRKCPNCQRAAETGNFCASCGAPTIEVPTPPVIPNDQPLTFAVPEGFSFDSKSGRYGRSEYDPASGTRIGMTFFDAVTGQYEQVSYASAVPPVPTSPFAAAYPQGTAEVPPFAAAPRPKPGKKKLLIILCSGLVLLVAAAVAYFFLFNTPTSQTIRHINAGEYEAALKTLEGSTDRDASDLRIYCEANLAFESGEYKTAAALFGQLDDFADAAALEAECLLRASETVPGDTNAPPVITGPDDGQLGPSESPEVSPSADPPSTSNPAQNTPLTSEQKEMVNRILGAMQRNDVDEVDQILRSETFRTFVDDLPGDEKNLRYDLNEETTMHIYRVWHDTFFSYHVDAFIGRGGDGQFIGCNCSDGAINFTAMHVVDYNGGMANGLFFEHVKRYTDAGVEIVSGTGMARDGKGEGLVVFDWFNENGEEGSYELNCDDNPGLYNWFPEWAGQ